jgi:hypothetical protein
LPRPTEWSRSKLRSARLPDPARPARTPRRGGRPTSKFCIAYPTGIPDPPTKRLESDEGRHSEPGRDRTSSRAPPETKAGRAGLFPPPRGLGGGRAPAVGVALSRFLRGSCIGATAATQMPTSRANEGRGLRALISPETREEARLPRICGKPGRGTTCTDGPAVHDGEMLENGEIQARSGRRVSSLTSLV